MLFSYENIIQLSQFYHRYHSSVLPGAFSNSRTIKNPKVPDLDSMLEDMKLFIETFEKVSGCTVMVYIFYPGYLIVSV